MFVCCIYIFAAGIRGKAAKSCLGTDLCRKQHSAKWHVGSWLWHLCREPLSANWHALAVGCGIFAESHSRQRDDGTSRRESHFILPGGTVWLSAKSLPSARVLALGKFLFAGEVYTGWPLPSTALGKGFTGGFGPFAECPWHSAYNSIPVVTPSPAVLQSNGRPCQFLPHPAKGSPS
jgi:hypothetical protein